MKRKWVPAICAALALVLVAALPALSVTGSVGTAAGFEDDDGNLAPGDTSSINFDWNSFNPEGTWTGTAPQRVVAKTQSGWQFKGVEDWQASTADSAFSGGTKQDDECAGVITQKADNKADLKRIYLASKTVSGRTYLMLGWVRIPQNTTSPSAHVAFEFNQGTTACGADSDGLVERSTANGGDMLILYDFEGGNDDPVIRLSRWVGSGACEVSSHNAPCWGTAVTLAPGTAEAEVNVGGSVSDVIAPTDETLDVKEFGEAGIDLTAAGVFTANTCTTFGKAFGVSRTSGNSGTAQMKDLVGPTNFALTNCANVNVTKAGSDGGAQTGAVFTLYSGANTSGTVIGTCTVVASGQCGTNPSFSNLQPGQYTIDETTVPSGYNKDASLPYTFTLGSSNLNLPFTNPAAPGTVNISKTDDAGNALNGAVFTLYSGASTSGTVVGTCTTGTSNYNDSATPAAGACSFVNITPGQYTVDETTVPTGYAKASGLPATFTLANGGTVNLPSSGSYVDPRLFKIIAMVCQQSNTNLYPSAITIDSASAGNSISRAQLDTLIQTWATAQGLGTLTTAQKAAFEDAVCGITQGAKSDRKAAPDSSNPHSASVNIPNS